MPKTGGTIRVEQMCVFSFFTFELMIANRLFKIVSLSFFQGIMAFTDR